MNNPRISVILPVYNGLEYIKESIASVVNQTLTPIELLLVDDGSTDGSRDFIERIELPFPKKVLFQQNKRQSAARNLAASHASGDYLAFLDHDDIWYPQHLEKLVAPMVEDSWIGWTYSDVDEIDSGGRLICRNSLRIFNARVEHPKTSLVNLLSADMFIFPSAALVRRAAFDQVGGFDERLSGYEDDDFFLRLFRAGWLNVFFADALVRYRRHSTSSSFSERMWISRDIYANKLITEFPDDPHLVRYYVRDLIAPRFYASAQAEYLRHFPHQRWKQCEMSLSLMRRFSKLSCLPFGRTRFKHWLMFQLLRSPKVFAMAYPVLRYIFRLPRL